MISGQLVAHTAAKSLLFTVAAGLEATGEADAGDDLLVVLGPGFAAVAAGAKRLQSGRLDAYLLYLLIALVAVVAVVTAMA